MGLSYLLSSSAVAELIPTLAPPTPNQQGSFAQGVASFDPTDSQVLIWTRVSPASSTTTNVAVTYQLATDAAFSGVVKTESVDALADDDFALSGLRSNTRYYYRFGLANTSAQSVVGETKTLPKGTELAKVKLVFCSCSNYPAGLFNVYGAIAASDADVCCTWATTSMNMARGNTAATPPPLR